MRNFVKMYALAWDFLLDSGGGFPLFAFGGSLDDLEIEFKARMAKTISDTGPGSAGNLTGPSKIYVLLDKDILVRYFNGAPTTAGDGNQSITGPLYGLSVGVTPTSQLWPMVYQSPKKKGWSNVFTGKRHKAQR